MITGGCHVTGHSNPHNQEPGCPDFETDTEDVTVCKMQKCVQAWSAQSWSSSLSFWNSLSMFVSYHLFSCQTVDHLHHNNLPIITFHMIIFNVTFTNYNYKHFGINNNIVHCLRRITVLTALWSYRCLGWSPWTRSSRGLDKCLNVWPQELDSTSIWRSYCIHCTDANVSINFDKTDRPAPPSIPHITTQIFTV